VKRRQSSAVFAQRVLEGVDDAGVPERVVIWIERKQGAVWAVGRSVNPQHRRSEEPRADDFIFEGYELEDALECANATLDDDARVSAQDGRAASVDPFAREELLKPLERWFFGH
jgi:DNA helicase TIP49 (TBP-interacting protein)